MRATQRVVKRTSRDEAENLMQEFLAKVTEASYQVALKTGFRGSFINFLTDLQEALDQVIQKDRERRERQVRSTSKPRALH